MSSYMSLVMCVCVCVCVCVSCGDDSICTDVIVQTNVDAPLLRLGSITLNKGFLGLVIDTLV